MILSMKNFDCNEEPRIRTWNNLILKLQAD